MGLAKRKSESVCFLKQLIILCILCTVTIIECTLGHSIGSSAGIKVELTADLVCVALPLFLCAQFLAHQFEVLFGEVPWCAACCQLQSGVQWCSPWCKMVFPIVNFHSPWCTVVFSLVYCDVLPGVLWCSPWCTVAPRALPSSQLFARAANDPRPSLFCLCHHSFWASSVR